MKFRLIIVFFIIELISIKLPKLENNRQIPDFKNNYRTNLFNIIRSFSDIFEVIKLINIISFKILQDGYLCQTKMRRNKLMHIKNGNKRQNLNYIKIMSWNKGSSHFNTNLEMI